MSFSDWLSDVPVVGDLFEILALIQPAEVYAELREAMFWTEVGNTGLDTRQYMLAEQSLVPVVWNEAGSEVVSGKWEDINGYVSTDPEDFDIDHRVSFSQIVKEHPDFYALSKDEKLAVYNDLSNLQILHDDENISKSNATPIDYAKSIADSEARDAFLEQARNYLETVRGRFRA